ncbi:MAG: hypothetical protein EOP24_13505 [Hyphomicrobiales bacterium]|nr:MAG: hypothetical protein EOP24_13505 [Hyphomicrobiales bacterium]
MYDLAAGIHPDITQYLAGAWVYHQFASSYRSGSADLDAAQQRARRADVVEAQSPQPVHDIPDLVGARQRDRSHEQSGCREQRASPDHQEIVRRKVSWPGE